MENWGKENGGMGKWLMGEWKIDQHGNDRA
jgi:hypothetical protein